MKLKLSLLLNSLLCICPLTFITKALCLVATVKQFVRLLLWYQLRHLCLVYTMRCVTEVTPFQLINGNILQACRMGLTNHTQPIFTISHYWLLMPWRQTHLHTHILTSKQKWFQEPRCTYVAFGWARLVLNPPRLVCNYFGWFGDKHTIIKNFQKR